MQMFRWLGSCTFFWTRLILIAMMQSGTRIERSLDKFFEISVKIDDISSSF